MKALLLVFLFAILTSNVFACGEDADGFTDIKNEELLNVDVADTSSATPPTSTQK